MNIIKKLTYGLIKKLKFLPPAYYIKIYYEYYTDKKLNLKNSIEFNEKIQWIKVFFKPDILTKLVDKYEVRSYVKDKIGEEYLNPMLAVYQSYDEIDFEKLPNQFVIKGTHGCNYNLIVKNKEELNKKEAKRLIKKWLSRNYYYSSGLEWAYKNVPPRVIIENFMKEEGKNNLNDYKIYCFNGQPTLFHIDVDTDKNNYRCFYDLDWQKLPYLKGKLKMYSGEFKKPANLDEMIELAKVLSEPFPFVRVDFYLVNGKTIFGELTFYPGDGRTEFKPDDVNKVIGDYLNLPSIPNHKSFIDSI
ncbi:MAG: glycosyltransferase [Bacteroidetes bacterium]|nr:MAG: glycosyltransferase [Bacteroidota bacterium]